MTDDNVARITPEPQRIKQIGLGKVEVDGKRYNIEVQLNGQWRKVSDLTGSDDEKNELSEAIQKLLEEEIAEIPWGKFDHLGFSILKDKDISIVTRSDKDTKMGGISRAVESEAAKHLVIVIKNLSWFIPKELPSPAKEPEPIKEKEPGTTSLLKRLFRWMKPAEKDVLEKQERVEAEGQTPYISLSEEGPPIEGGRVRARAFKEIDERVEVLDRLHSVLPEGGSLSEACRSLKAGLEMAKEDFPTESQEIEEKRKQLQEEAVEVGEDSFTIDAVKAGVKEELQGKEELTLVEQQLLAELGSGTESTDRLAELASRVPMPPPIPQISEEQQSVRKVFAHSIELFDQVKAALRSMNNTDALQASINKLQETLENTKKLDQVASLENDVIQMKQAVARVLEGHADPALMEELTVEERALIGELLHPSIERLNRLLANDGAGGGVLTVQPHVLSQGGIQELENAKQMVEQTKRQIDEAMSPEKPSLRTNEKLELLRSTVENVSRKAANQLRQIPLRKRTVAQTTALLEIDEGLAYEEAKKKSLDQEGRATNAAMRLNHYNEPSAPRKLANWISKKVPQKLSRSSVQKRWGEVEIATLYDQLPPNSEIDYRQELTKGLLKEGALEVLQKVFSQSGELVRNSILRDAMRVLDEGSQEASEFFLQLKESGDPQDHKMLFERVPEYRREALDNKDYDSTVLQSFLPDMELNEVLLAHSMVREEDKQRVLTELVGRFGFDEEKGKPEGDFLKTTNERIHLIKTRFEEQAIAGKVMPALEQVYESSEVLAPDRATFFREKFIKSLTEDQFLCCCESQKTEEKKTELEDFRGETVQRILKVREESTKRQAAEDSLKAFDELKELAKVIDGTEPLSIEKDGKIVANPTQAFGLMQKPKVFKHILDKVERYEQDYNILGFSVLESLQNQGWSKFNPFAKAKLNAVREKLMETAVDDLFASSWENYDSVDSKELNKVIRNQPSEKLNAIAARQRHLSNYICNSILSEKDVNKRALVMGRFIEMGYRAAAKGDFQTMIDIQFALGNISLGRLKETKERLTAKQEEQWEKIKDLSEPHYKNLRKEVEGRTTYVPLFAMFQGQITMAREALGEITRGLEESKASPEKLDKALKEILEKQIGKVKSEGEDTDKLEETLKLCNKGDLSAEETEAVLQISIKNQEEIVQSIVDGILAEKPAKPSIQKKNTDLLAKINEESPLDKVRRCKTIEQLKKIAIDEGVRESQWDAWATKTQEKKLPIRERLNKLIELVRGELISIEDAKFYAKSQNVEEHKRAAMYIP